MRQIEALAILKTGANVFLTGEPGAGKSHTIRQFVDYLRSCGIEPAITASTGIAATHIGGMTIHSWSGIGIKDRLSRADLKEIAERDRLARRILATHTLIIDEISMLSGNTLNMVDAVCKTIKESDEPFGGIQIVFVGDFFQLPPISRDAAEAPLFAFASDAWYGANPVICYLSEQHRQEDPAFLEVLAAMRTGTVPAKHKQRLQDRYAAHAEHEDVTKLYPHNADVDRINVAWLSRLPGESRTFAMSGHGARPLVEQLQRGCLSPETLVLKRGAKVMFTKNHFEEGFVNGTTGEVTDFSTETKYPIVTLRSGRTIEVQPDTWAIEAEGQMLAAITQLPLRLAWAITVHKSQGMSLDAAYVDLSQAFAFGQGYVALSRVRSLDGLFLGGLNERALQVDQDVLAKDEEFRAQSVDAQAEFGSMDADDLRKRQDEFVARCGGSPAGTHPLNTFLSLVKKRKVPPHEETLTLVKEGKTLHEVAAARDRKLGTIIEHLEKLLEEGKVKVEEIAHVAAEIDLKKIHDAFRELGASPLKPVHQKLKGKHSYETLRIARLFFEE